MGRVSSWPDTTKPPCPSQAGFVCQNPTGRPKAATLTHRNIVNVGGVICALVEYRGGTETQPVTTIAEKIRRNTQEVLTEMRAYGTLPRDATNALAEARLREAMALRRRF